MNLRCFPNEPAHFAHELTHVWQLYHFPDTWYGWHALTDHVLNEDSASYVYTLVDGKDFGDYGLEEQAAIVQASTKPYRRRRKRSTSRTP